MQTSNLNPPPSLLSAQNDQEISTWLSISNSDYRVSKEGATQKRHLILFDSRPFLIEQASSINNIRIGLVARICRSQSSSRWSDPTRPGFNSPIRNCFVAFCFFLHDSRSLTSRILEKTTLCSNWRTDWLSGSFVELACMHVRAWRWLWLL